MEPMYGSVQCLLVLGEVEEAEQQLELLVEISVSMGKSASLCYVMAQLVWKKEKDYSRCRDLLAETIALQSKVKQLVFNLLRVSKDVKDSFNLVLPHSSKWSIG